jgi:hypothetical protein
MSCLQHLAVCGTPLLAEAEGEEAGSDDDSDQEEEGRELGLKVLSGLTQLQHLELPQTRKQLAADPTTADVAALTASSHLTSLIIDQGLVRHHQYCHMFPEGRQLAKLRELRATMGLVGTEANVLKLVRCCPNLERLDAAEGACNLLAVVARFCSVEVCDISTGAKQLDDIYFAAQPSLCTQCVRCNWCACF